MAAPRKPRMHERHKIPSPDYTGTADRPTGAGAEFFDALKERIRDLFNGPAVAGHAVQIQQELNRLSNSNLSTRAKTDLAKKTLDQVVKAAQFAKADFARFKLGMDTVCLTIERTHGKLICRRKTNTYWPYEKNVL